MYLWSACCSRLLILQAGLLSIDYLLIAASKDDPEASENSVLSLVVFAARVLDLVSAEESPFATAKAYSEQTGRLYAP